MTPSRLLASLLLAAITCTGAAPAQVALKIVSEACKDAQNTSLREVDRRIAAQRAAIDKLKKDRQKAARATGSQAQVLNRKIQDNQESLMDLIFSRECLRQDLQPEGVLVEKI